MPCCSAACFWENCWGKLRLTQPLLGVSFRRLDQVPFIARPSDPTRGLRTGGTKAGPASRLLLLPLLLLLLRVRCKH